MIQTKAVMLLSLALALGVFSGTIAAACNQTPPAPVETPVVPEPAAVPVQAAPVTRGDLRQVLSYTGDIRSGAQIQVLPKASGRIERLNVDVGSQVNAGDVLAELDRLTVQAQLDQAQATLAGAEARLAGQLAGPKDEDVEAAAAQVALAQAQLDQASSPARREQLAQAEAQLNELRARLAQVSSGQKPEDIAALEAEVDRTGSAVEQSRQGLDSAAATTAGAQAQVRSGEDGVAQADARLASADEQLNVARAAVEAAESGIVAAQSALSEAQLRQQQAQRGEGGPGVRPEDIAIAQTQVEQARQAYERLINSPTPEEIAVAEAAVETAEERVDAAEAALDAAEGCSGVGCPDEDTAAENVDVAEAQVDEAEAALEQVLAGPTEFEIESARQAIVAAELLVEKLRTGGNADATTLALTITNAETALTGAETALQQAEAQLGQARAGYEEAQAGRIAALDGLGQAQAALQQAKIGEQTTQSGVMIAEAVQLSAQARLDSARNPDFFDVAAAREAVNRAQASLEELQNPDLFNIRTNQASLEQAQAQLASTQRPFTEEDIQAQQATVDQARAGVQAVQVALEETFVRAPIAGVVSEKLASEGALVGGTTPIVTLVPPGLELNVAVEEANLAAVQTGQQVTVSVAAYPDREFQGRVRTVSPTVDPQSRTVQVTIDLDDPQNLLRPGMFAQLGIVTQERAAVLVIPRAAVLNRTTQPTVFVVRENRAVRVPIALGVSDAERVEVTEGLREGELVVTSGQNDLTEGDPVVVQTP